MPLLLPPTAPLTVDAAVGTFLDQLDVLIDKSMTKGVVGGTTIAAGAFGVIADNELRERVRNAWRLAFAAMLQKFADDGIPGVETGGGGAAINPATTVVSEAAFSLPQLVGVDVKYARADHSHGTPVNPVLGHVDAANPHPQYVLTGSGRDPSFTASCPSGIVVGDLVYMTGADAVDIANVDNDGSGRVAGIVESKPSSTTCVVRTDGKVTGLSGLVANTRYFCSALGRPTTVCTRGSEATPTLATAIGVAVNATTLALRISPPIRVKST